MRPASGSGKIQPRELAMMLDSGGVSGARALFCGVKISVPHPHAVELKFGEPPAGLLEKTYPPIPARVVAAKPAVGFVLAASRRSEVCFSVSSLYPEAMVDLVIRPNAIDKEPREAMPQIVTIAESNASVATHRRAPITGDFANLSSPAGRFFPSKNSRIWVVCQVIDNIGWRRGAAHMGSLHTAKVKEQ